MQLLKEEYARKKNSKSLFCCKLKIPSLGITVRYHSASLVMPNNYPHDGIFHLHLTTINDSYILILISVQFLYILFHFHRMYIWNWSPTADGLSSTQY